MLSATRKVYTSTCLVILFYAAVLVGLIYNDKLIFDEVGRLSSIYRQGGYSKFLTTEELHRAFHIDQEYIGKKDIAIILLYLPAFGQVQSIGNNVDGCVMTYDQSVLDIADVVVFHVTETYDFKNRLPLDRRKPWQRWVWWCREPPWNTRFVFQKSLTDLNGVFNWTMTYRTDSDVYFPYGNTATRVNKTTKQMLEDKSAKALGIWVVSNCRPSRRGSIIRKLQQYMRIDVMGKCNDRPLCRGDCALDVIKRYKFYFSFENSRCKEYISEKFWENGIAAGAVPVVMGASRKDYETAAPPKSFIHVEDFDTVDDLARYLLLLDKDDEKYSEYLKWRSIPDGNWKEADAFNNRRANFAGLCDKIKSAGDEVSIVENLDTWWYGDGYTPESESFSVCTVDDGPSGTPLRRYVTFGYICLLCMLCFVTVWLVRKFRRK